MDLIDRMLMDRIVYDTETRNVVHLPPRKIDLEAIEEIKSLRDRVKALETSLRLSRDREKELEDAIRPFVWDTETPMTTIEAKRYAHAILKN